VQFGWIFLLALLFVQKGFAHYDITIEERIELIEERRGYFHKKKSYQGVVQGDLLYWKANVDGVAYETTSIAAPGGGSTNIKTRTPHFPYDPGLRLALGFQAPHGFFDLNLVWTRFYTKGDDHAHASADKSISPGIGLIQPLISTPNHASAECSIKENILDLQFARGIKISRHCLMRPYFGFRALWSDVHWDISLKRKFLVPEPFDQDSTRFRVKNDFTGAGGLMGLELDWNMPYGLGLRASVTGALVYGLTEEKTHQFYTLLPSSSATSLEQNFHARNSFHSVKGQLGFFAGLFWESHAIKKKKKERLQVRLFAGYELQQWPYIGQKTNIQVSRQRERFSLGFEGFTGGAKIFF
jgi:hypothetical protein